MDLTLIAIGLGLLAIVYGFVTSRQVLNSSPGSAKMQEIAGAIAEGAQAYLRRQYLTIGIVGVVLLANLVAALPSGSYLVASDATNVPAGRAAFATVFCPVQAARVRIPRSTAAARCSTAGRHRSGRRPPSAGAATPGW